jgi:hypothetical protein
MKVRLSTLQCSAVLRCLLLTSRASDGQGYGAGEHVLLQEQVQHHRVDRAGGRAPQLDAVAEQLVRDPARQEVVCQEGQEQEARRREGVDDNDYKPNTFTCKQNKTRKDKAIEDITYPTSPNRN